MKLRLSRLSVCTAVAIAALTFNPSVIAAKDDNNIVARMSLELFSVQGEAKAAVVDKLVARQDPSLIPTLVLAMRWTGSDTRVAKALSTLTGETITTWHDAYVWQERHPEILPHESYRELKLKFLGNTDSRFRSFFDAPYGAPEQMRIRLEEVVWGGVLFDEIPSLDHATMLEADDAEYLLDQDLVFGVEINGDVRAYPLRILGWHEMVNDVIGGVPVVLAYCTLCGSGILFETEVSGIDKPLVFGSSGLLYRSNKLIFDRESSTLWNQYTGEPVVGPLVASGIQLKLRPITIASWEQWRRSHPQTTVLSLETGYSRNYDSGVTYNEYFASPDLLFPAVVADEAVVVRKDYIFGVRTVAASKAWPLDVFSKTPLINDQVGAQALLLVGNADTRTVRAYERKADERFELDKDGSLISGELRWEAWENFLVSSDGKQKRGRVAGHVSYWFAWDNFLGSRSELYSD